MESDSQQPQQVTPPPVITPPSGQLRRVWRFIIAHPWISVLLCLVFGLALAVIGGLDPGIAQLSLVFGLIMIGFIRFVGWAWGREKSAKAKTPTSAPPAPAKPKGFLGQCVEAFGTTVAFCICATVVYSYKSSRDAAIPVPPSSGSVAATPSIVGSKTQQYWQATVAALHPHRFGDSPEAQSDALAAWRSRLDHHRSSLVAAQALPQTDVDHDLVTMINHHLNVDQQYLQRQETLLSSTEKLATTPEDSAALKRLSYAALTQRIHDGLTNGQLPPEINQQWRAVAEDHENCDRIYREIQVMQARLKERYKSEGRLFQLPKIPGAAPDSRP